MVFYPPSQKATDVNPWMNARRVFSVALVKEDMLRRVAPDEACGGCHGRKPVGLHLGAQQFFVEDTIQASINCALGLNTPETFMITAR